MDFERFQAVSFDCYGTLIDWERGIIEALRPILSEHGLRSAGDDGILALFARFEAAAEGGPYRSYRHVVMEVASAIGRELGIEVTDEAAEVFAASVPAWPPFEDSADALSGLSKRYRLAVVSNVDDDLFAGSAKLLGASFDEVVTAEQLRSYKPGHAHFVEVVARLAVPRGRVLHVAQSLYHDIGPATELGIATVWVNRRAGKPGTGATAPSEAKADLEVPDLRTLVQLVGS